jgi:hypothetical protein
MHTRRFAPALLLLASLAGCSYQTTGQGTTALADDGGTSTTSPPGSDASAVTPPPGGTGGSDASGPSTGCAPASVSSFTPRWVPPTAVHQNACPGAEVSDYYTACFDTAAPAGACSGFRTQYAACAHCIETSEGSPSYGPIILYSQLGYELNVGGCIDRTASTQLTCAENALYAFECERAACGHCSFSDQATYTTYLACVSAADKGVCARYVAQASACYPLLPNTAAECENAPDFKTGFLYIAGLFCGP